MKGAIDLPTMLAAREQRALHQQEAARRHHGLPLISLTLVSPGPVKQGLRQQQSMRAALAAIDHCLSQALWPALERNVWWRQSGPEALYVVNAEATALKAALVALEENHPLGRLWDVDVIVAGKPLSRQALGLEERRCLLCDEAAHACARSQAHPLESLLQLIEERIDAFHGAGQPH